MTARVRRFDARKVFDEVFADIKGDLEVVHKDRVEQPALNSWLLF
jgi:hypothetical protein